MEGTDAWGSSWCIYGVHATLPSAGAGAGLHPLDNDATDLHRHRAPVEGAQKKSSLSDLELWEAQVHDENAENPLLSIRTNVQVPKVRTGSSNG